MWPQPRPARRKACFAPRSARRQVSGDCTAKSRPAVNGVRSVSTSCTCFDAVFTGTVPRCAAIACVGAATVTKGTASSGSATTPAGRSGSEPTTPMRHVPSSTGWITPPRTSTYNRSGVCGNAARLWVAARVSAPMGNITSTATESSGSRPSATLRARALKVSMCSATARASTSSSRPASVSCG